MSFVADVFTHWQDPAIRAQRNWIFTLLWGRTSNQRLIWPLAYMLLLCGMAIFPTDFVRALYFPLAFLAFAPSLNTAALIEALGRWRIRKPAGAVLIAQALLLNSLVWSLIGLLFWYRTANPTVWVLMGFAWLFGQFMAFALPQAFAQRSLHPAQGHAWPVLLALAVLFVPLFALLLYPQYEIWIRAALLLCTVGLLLGLRVQIQRFGQPRVMSPRPASTAAQQASLSAKSALRFRIETNLGFALDAKGWRKLLGQLLLTPYALILLYQHVLPMPAVNQWGAGALFAMQTGAFLVHFSARRQWSNAWLSRTHSRSQLWWQDEQLFVGGLLLITGLNCLLLRLLGMDNGTQIMNAALLFVVGMAFLRYLVLSLPWLNLFGLNARGRTDLQGIGLAFILLMPIWFAVAWVWSKGVQDQIELMIISLAAPTPILAYFSYRYALQIDLGAIRRAKLS
ncbi:hypothetical protein [Chitinibacter sp. ZOR0017]|uniref:hypothetical protein n=1 Tax=Chitinibacter sp. ZOR0017 TaxID=1339254 RepID=UPI00064644EC|nr:hypothetical protein [Chitinibacter sp. ZOR0017]